MTDDKAMKIAQDTLDRQAADTERGDLEATLNWCDIPCTLETTEGRVVVTDIEEMRAICQDFIVQLNSKQLTHMVRRVFEASYQDADTVMATYETRFVTQGQLLTQDPYMGFVILRRRETGWKISNMQFTSDPESPANTTMRNR